MTFRTFFVLLVTPLFLLSTGTYHDVVADENEMRGTLPKLSAVPGSDKNIVPQQGHDQESISNFSSISDNVSRDPAERYEQVRPKPEEQVPQIEFSPGLSDVEQQSETPDKIQATIINPFRSAAVATEVGGIIAEYNFEIGDRVEKGKTILEISKKRYDLAVQKAKQNLVALELAVKRAEKDKEIKERLVSLDASSVQELLKAETELEIVQSKLREAQITLNQTLLDLESCQVKAPFTGYLALRYKEPFEAASPLEKLFAFIDSSKVYAVAYVPESLMQYFKKGSKAAFNDPNGRQFVGEVDKIEPLIDPKTGSQKVFVLLDNADERLGIGTTGSLESVK